jgi:hypothetical protein
MSVTTPSESSVLDAIAGMLARPDFLLPLAAAERQFRDHYYGLNSAALLEDLFFDALGNFLRQTRPETALVRPSPGQKGWDYSFDGLRISHKVSQRADVIAALWDATKRDVQTWSFDDPIVYVLGGNTPPTSLQVELETGELIAARAIADLKPPYATNGRTLLVVDWPPGGRQPRILEVVPTSKNDNLADVVPFDQVWRHVAPHVAAGRPANSVDVLVTSKALPPMLLDELVEGDSVPCGLSVGARSGVYLFARELLQNLAVSSNNRGILIPKPTVVGLLAQAELAGLFSPLPLWYWAYAEERPPDLYSIQRAEYDARFSARGHLTS